MKKILFMVVLAVGVFFAGQVLADTADYTVTVLSGQNTVLTVNDAAFSDLATGASDEITGSLTLTNTGNAAASVDAAFTTSYNSVFGFVAGTDVIGASNFQLGTDSNEVALLDSGATQALGVSNNVAANSSVNYDAILAIPQGQPAAAYSGTVELTFSTV